MYLNCRHVKIEGTLGDGGLNCVVLMRNYIMQGSHMAQVLGNVTYTEVVVSSAGLATLSVQT